MPTDSPSYQIELTRTFHRSLCTLEKTYPTIRDDIAPVMAQLQVGEFVGDRVPNIHPTIFKVRIRASDSEDGKGGRYRLIYWVNATKIALITIYSKSYQGDVSIAELQWLLAGFLPSVDNE